jgi:hypothetical protein
MVGQNRNGLTARHFLSEIEQPGYLRAAPAEKRKRIGQCASRISFVTRKEINQKAIGLRLRMLRPSPPALTNRVSAKHTLVCVPTLALYPHGSGAF